MAGGLDRAAALLKPLIAEGGADGDRGNDSALLCGIHHALRPKGGPAECSTWLLSIWVRSSQR